MDDVAMCGSSLAGGSPAASHFSYLAKKSNQKKATPLRHPFGAGLD
jgi:hypothetical protein